jgi:hypothetical protein
MDQRVKPGGDEIVETNDFFAKSWMASSPALA